mgnify:CR=1 FL=1
MRVVLGENQLHVNLARVAYLGAVGINLHAFLDDVVARGDQLFLALDLHDADAAGADLVDFLEKTALPSALRTLIWASCYSSPAQTSVLCQPVIIWGRCWQARASAGCSFPSECSSVTSSSRPSPPCMC